MLILITWLEHFFLSYFHSISYLVLLHTIRTQFTPHPTHMQAQPNKATGHMLGWCGHFKCQKISNAYSQLTCLSHPRPVKVCRLAWVHDHTLSSIVLTHTTQEVSVNDFKSSWVWFRNKKWIWVGILKSSQWEWEGILVRILSIPLSYRCGIWVSGVWLHMGMWWQADGTSGSLVPNQGSSHHLTLTGITSVPPKRKSREENRGGAGKGLKSTAKLNFSPTSGPPATLLKLQWTAEKTKTFKEKQRCSLGYNWYSDHWRQFILSR